MSKLLCCCEFQDENGETRHMLELCCNCVILDDTFNRCISCKPIENGTFKKFYNDLSERIRIPCCDGYGSRKILPPPNCILDFWTSKLSVAMILIVLALMIVAGLSFFMTFISVISLQCILIYLMKNIMKRDVKEGNKKSTSLLFVFVASSTVCTLLVFEYVIIPTLKISFYENIVLMCFLSLGIVPYYVMKIEGEWRKATTHFIPSGLNFCDICLCKATNHEHNIWLNVCVHKRFKTLFTFSMVMLLFGIIYGCLLTLTTLCFSQFYFSNFILLPYNCADVYNDYTNGVAFACVLLSLSYALIIFIKLIMKVVSLKGFEDGLKPENNISIV